MAEKFSITGVINVTPPTNLKQIASQIKKDLSTPISLNLDAKQSASKLAKDVRNAFKAYPIPINLLPIQSVNNIAKDIQKQLNGKSFSLKIKVANIKQISDDIEAYLKGRTIPVNIQINAQNVTAATKGLINIRDSANESADAMENLARQTAITIRRFGIYTIATAAFFKLNRSIREGVQEAIEFDTQFVKIRQVTKQSANSLAQLTNEVGRLSTGLGVSSKELLGASQVLAQAGFSTRQVSIALETLAKADLSPTFDSINQASEGTIALLNQFGLSIEELESKFGSINSVSAKFAVESSDLITGIQTAGGAFSAAGGDVEELLGLFTSVRETTRASASSIAVGLKTISTRLQRGRTQSFLKDLGVDLKFTGEEARKLGKEGLFVGVYESIRRISSALKSIPKNDPRFAQIAEELGGFRQIDKVIPLLTEFELAERARGVAIRDTDSLTKDSIIAQESLANQFAKVREEFNLLIRDIGGSDFVRDSISQFLQLASAAIRLTETLERLAIPLTLIAGFKLAQTTGTLGKLVFKNLTGGQGKLPAFATGGMVPGVGNKDSVNARLMPGEYVINKKASKRLGKERLDILNQGDLPAFASGGPFGKVPGGVGTVAVAGFAFESLVFAFKDLEDSTKTLITGLVGAGIQFAAITSILKPSEERIKAFNDSLKDSIEPFKKNFNIDKGLDDKAQRNLSRVRARFQRSPNVVTNRRLNAAELISKQTSQELKISKEALSVQEKINKQKEKEFRNVQRINTGLASAAAGLTVASEFFDKLGSSGLETIRGGDKSNLSSARRNTAIGAATGGAATGVGGALLGNAALPALGIAAFSGPVLLAGAAVAGLTYGIYRGVEALDEFDKEVRSIDITKVSDDLSKALQSVSSGKSSVFLQRNSVIGSLNELRGNLRTEADPQNREDINAAIDGSINGLQEFIDATIKSSISLDQFKDVIPDDTLDFFARRTGQSLDVLSNRIKETIESQASFNDRFKESLLSLQAFEIRLRAEVALSNAIKQSISGLDSLNNEFNNVSSGSINTNTGSNLTGRLGNLGAVGNVKSLEVELKEFTRFFGNSLQGTAEDSIDAANAIKLLPNILLDLRNSDPLSGSGDIVDNLNDTLRSAGVGDAVRASIVNEISKFGEGGKGDSGIIDAISKNLNGILESITGNVSSVSKPLEEASRKINDELSVFAQGLELSNKAILDSRNRLISTFDNAQNFFNITSENPTSKKGLGQQRNLLNERQNLVTEGRGSDQVLNDLVNSQQRLIELNELLEQTTDIEGRKEIISLQQEQALKIQKSNQALDFLSDSVKRASVLEAELNKERSDRRTRKGLAERITFSTAEERAGINRSIEATRLAAGAGTIDVVPESLRKEVLSFLNDVGDATLDGLGGKSGTEILDQLVASSLKSAGIDSSGILKPSDSEKGITNNIESIFLESQKIQTELAKIEESNLTKFVSNLNQSFDSFLSNLRGSLLSEQRGFADQEILSIQGNVKQSQRLIGAGNQLQQLSGVDPDTLRVNFEGIVKSVENLEKSVAISSKLSPDSKNFREILRDKSFSNINNDVKKGKVDFIVYNEKTADLLINNLLKSIGNKYGKEVSDQVNLQLNEGGGLAKIREGTFFSPANSGNLVFDEVSNILSEISKNSLKETDKFSKEIDSFSKNVGVDNLDKIISNSSKISNIIGSLPENVKFSDLSNDIQKLTTQLAIANQRRAALGFNSGGYVPGSGSTDTVPAMLTPGEVVINKRAVQRIGANNLLKLNKPVQNFNQGGMVQSIDQSSLGIFNASINTFMNGINTIAQALSNIPSKIEMTGNHRVEVVINGSQVLSTIMPEISGLVKGEIKKSINRLITERFPEQGAF